jgi:hypothetical protein
VTLYREEPEEDAVSAFVLWAVKAGVISALLLGYYALMSWGLGKVFS